MFSHLGGTMGTGFWWSTMGNSSYIMGYVHGYCTITLILMTAVSIVITIQSSTSLLTMIITTTDSMVITNLTNLPVITSYWQWSYYQLLPATKVFPLRTKPLRVAADGITMVSARSGLLMPQHGSRCKAPLRQLRFGRCGPWIVDLWWTSRLCHVML